MNAEITQRIGDAERDDAVAALTGHFVAGRLDKDELDQRLERALTARSRGDLAVLFDDLPTKRERPPRRDHRPYRPGWRLPVLPLVALVVLAVIALPGPPWPLLILAWLWFSRLRCGPRLTRVDGRRPSTVARRPL